MATTAHRTKAHRLTPEQRAAKVDALTDRLNQAVADLSSGEQWAAMLRVAAKFHNYSGRNVMLLWAQATERGATLTRVAGFHTWRGLGRTVRKGEKGYAILAPVARRLSAEEAAERGAEAYDGAGKPRRVVRGFRVEHVFDIAQTDGDPLPEVPSPAVLSGEDPAGLWEALAALVEAEGYRIERNPEADATQGWTNYRTRVVSVRPDVPAAQATYVLAHELGHIRADHEHRDIPREQRETEADSIAYVVATACGLDSAASSTPYVAGWSGGDPKIIEAAAETVRRGAAAILGDLSAAEVREDQAAESPAEEPAAAAA
ncbi:ArdC-like ssDNA-binding domain-containing protein (plasmid) [Pseudonocardia bannensis]|uniref:DUF1738 domain-containing protein n=1 Tax=Pseudonocardia bannensis TaxID=630973 RepID=A0A848DNV3_9PSEU|nr:ArdC-like ssDNA-binding domain-containing protein [Pseudonocardia bannensis]NMH94487.1 DUF1738 domain-containing protein [Pseudonocardia bannensis]